MASGAARFVLTDDTRVGGPSAGPSASFPGLTPWAINITYAVGAMVQNGPFLFRCSVSGASAASGLGPCPQYLTDNAATWTLTGGYLPVTATDAAASMALGTIITGIDQGPNGYGVAEFVYLKFTGSTNIVAGDFVQIDRYAMTCTQSPTGLASANSPVVIGAAMGSHALATATPTYGWAMIRGVHDALNITTGSTAGYCCSLGAAAGRLVGGGYVSNKSVEAVICKNVSANNVGAAELYYPNASGR